MQYGNLIIQIRNLGLIIVFGARLFDLCLRLVQLRLTQLDNRTEPEFVSLLRKIQSQTGVVEKLLRQGEALETLLGIRPCQADVTSNAVGFVPQFLIGRFRSQLRFRGADGIEPAIKDRDVDI